MISNPLLRAITRAVETKIRRNYWILAKINIL